MKTIAVCFLLSTVSLTYVTSLSLPSKNFITSKEIDEIRPLLQTPVYKTNNQQAAVDDEGEKDIANLEGILNVME